MDILYQFDKIIPFLDQNTLKSPAKQGAVIIMRAIKPLSVQSIDVTHTSGQVAFRRLNQHMILIRQQAIRTDTDIPEGC